MARRIPRYAFNGDDEVCDTADDNEPMDMGTVLDLLNAQNDRVAELEAEAFALAANQCHSGYGDERGHHRCKYQARIAELEAAVSAARALHSVGVKETIFGLRDRCSECHMPWPCRTTRVIAEDAI